MKNLYLHYYFKNNQTIYICSSLLLCIFFLATAGYATQQPVAPVASKLATSSGSMSDPKVIAAIIVALVGAVVSIVTAIWSYYTNRKSQIELEHVKAQIAEQQSVRDARRDYEYEARKRLYEQYEPLLFQLVELSEDALHRIYSLARTARKGQITETKTGWLRAPNYYMISSIYKLLAPIAIFKLMRGHLTLVDLRVDPRIGAQYSLAKILYFAFTCDYELAEIEPKIEYHPNVENWHELRQNEPQKHWRQGLALGRLDNALDDLLIEKNGEFRLRTFGEFQALIDNTSQNNSLDSYSLTDIFLDFHPNTRPVLWRLLVTQAHIHRLITQRIGISSSDPIDDMKQNITIQKEMRALFDWRTKNDTTPDKVVIEEPFNVATVFIKKYLDEQLQCLVSPNTPDAEQSRRADGKRSGALTRTIS